ncbi:MAG: M14 family zinc carboxypeptidase [Bacteroidota bacterium]
MKNLLLSFCCLFLTITLSAQIPDGYYLPDIDYDEDVTSPAEYLGYQVGKWHLTHDQQYGYLRELARTSDRVQLVEYARSYEERPLIYLIITGEENQQNIDELKAQHVQLADADNSRSLNTADMPVVTYQGYNIHGNEPSGGNAAVLYAYYLAAGNSEKVRDQLDNAIVLLDPCYNPDGFHRFSTWVNMHKNENLTSDPQDREYRESWPGARTNHYWFDLNRDWLPVQHPESQGRIRNFYEWRPNVLTDHHEMGSNATFFFQPGIPQRTNPITPQRNQDLTAKIGNYHAKALDEIGSFYYTQESFDDYYYGKGSTYPDANGAIGILFEQSSSRGHLQETRNGLLSFPFTIKNQLVTSISTLDAATGMRTELLDYQRDFFRDAADNGQKAKITGYVISETKDKGRLNAFLDIMEQHQVEVYALNKDVRVGEKNFKSGESFVIPADQAQHTLIRGMFEQSTTFKDSLFYDVSAWTLPLAFNIDFAPLSSSNFSKSALGSRFMREDGNSAAASFGKSELAYLMTWDDYYAPKALNAVLAAGLRAKVATIPFSSGGRDYPYGTIQIQVSQQNLTADEIYQLLQIVAEETSVEIIPATTGLTPSGIDFGSNNFASLEQPKVLLLVGRGVNPYDAGEVWHLLDYRYDIPMSMSEINRLGSIDLSRYNTIVMVDGYYGDISSRGVEDLKDWSSNGGTIVAMKGAVRWLNGQSIANVTFKSGANAKGDARRPYASASADRGSEYIGGAIFESKIDLTHPLFYGYDRELLPVFRRGTLFFEPTNNPYATPAMYTDDPLLAGYIKSNRLEQLKNSATVVVNSNGRGKVICLADNPNFRAFWYGTNKLFANAVFFGNVISRATTE